MADVRMSLRPALDWKQDTMALGLFLLSLLLTYIPILFGSHDLISHDNLEFFLPAFLSEPKLWEPLGSLGFPVSADPQFQVFYPLRYLFPATEAGYHVYVFSALVIGAFFAYRYAHFLGGAFLPAVIAGLIFGFSGSLAGQITMSIVPQASAWLPAVLYFTHRLLVEGPARSRPNFLGLTLSVALALLTGHPQIFITMMLLAGALAVFLATGSVAAADPAAGFVPTDSLAQRIQQWKGRAGWLLRTHTVLRVFRQLLPAGVAVGLAICLAAIMWVPLLELLQYTARDGSGQSGVSDYTFELRHWVRLAFPYIYGAPHLPEGATGDWLRYPFFTTKSHAYHELHRYFGLLPLLLLYPIWRLREWPHGTRLLFLGLALVAALYSLGPQTPLWPLLANVPGLSTFRGPVRHFLEISLIVGLGVALVLSRIVLQTDARLASSGDWTGERRRWTIGILIAALVLSALPLLYFSFDSLLAEASLSHYGVGLQVGLVWVGTAILLAGLWLERLRVAAIPLLLAFTIGDLAWNHRLADWYVYGEGVQRTEYPAREPARELAVLRDGARYYNHTPGRIAPPYDHLQPNQNLAAGYSSFGMYSPLLMKRAAHLRLAFGSAPQLLSVLGVAYQGSHLRLGPAKAAWFLLGSCPNRPEVGVFARRGTRLGFVSSVADGDRDQLRASALRLQLANVCPLSDPGVGAGNDLRLRIQLESGREVTHSVPYEQVLPYLIDCGSAASDAEVAAGRAIRRQVGATQCQQFSVVDLSLPPASVVRSATIVAPEQTMVTFGAIEFISDTKSAGERLRLSPAALSLLGQGQPHLITPGFVMARSPEALPRAYFVREVQGLPDACGQLALLRLASGGLQIPGSSRVARPGELAILEERDVAASSALQALSNRAGSPSDSPEGLPTVRGLVDESSRVRIKVDAPRAGLLVLNDAYYPGWIARVDGVETRVLRANYYVRALVVPAGSREVILEYRPLSLLLGTGLSLLGLFALLGLLLRRKELEQWTTKPPLN